MSHLTRTPHDRTPLKFGIELKGTFAWKLVLEYRNDSPDTVAYTFARTRMSIFKPHVFSAELNKIALIHLRECTTADFDHNVVFFEALSSTIPVGQENSQDINTVLKKTQDNLGVDSQHTETDTRVYTIPSDTSLSLYQRYFIAPGIHHDCNVYSTSLQETLPVIISVSSQQVMFISSIQVIFGREPLGAVKHRLIGGDGATTNSNINKDYLNGYAWLKPKYDLNKSRAASSFEVLRGRQDGPPPSNNLSENTEDERNFCYLKPVVSDSPYKIHELALLRSSNGEGLAWDPKWGYDGMTTDINFGRKGYPLYLAWKLRATAA